MTQTILIILGIVIIGLLVFKRTRTLLRVKLRKGAGQFVGICAAAIGLDAKKRERKEKILELLRERGELGNSDIREVLGVSDRTIIRYMDELEREGRVEQIGKTGHQVVYRLK